MLNIENAASWLNFYLEAGHWPTGHSELVLGDMKHWWTAPTVTEGNTEIIEHNNFVYFIGFDESVSVLYNLALEILEISFSQLNCA